MTKIDPIVFQPFGGGQRNCIGLRMAMMILKFTVAQILLKFRLRPTATTPVSNEVVLRGCSYEG